MFPAIAQAGDDLTAYDRHVVALKKRVPAGFTVVEQPPFVVIGDEAPAKVRERAAGTVKWASDSLKESYFLHDPDEIYDIWLFRDAKSYYGHAKELWNAEPDTPYGYASSRDRALVMNIATGGGTLVHEIVHPYIHRNFPESPAWFNEGLASLYEQCGERDGRIVGFTNWRLAGLQEAIRAGKVPTFEALMATTPREFYDEDPGTNYSQSRYLLYYLQQRGLLRPYYRAFVANHGEDPTGHQTLRKILAVEDMQQAQRDWESWVLDLKFP